MPTLTGVLLAEIASLISSIFLATDVAADLRLLIPPIINSFDFFEVKLLGLKILCINSNKYEINLTKFYTISNINNTLLNFKLNFYTLQYIQRITDK